MDPEPKQNRIDEGITWCYAVALLGCALFALILAAKTARLPMQFDYEEGNILNAGVRITQGMTPYPEAGSWPIVLNPYGPIPYLLSAACVKWFGISFFAPRMVSIVCGAVIALLIGLLIRRFGGSAAVSIIFACAFLSVVSIRNWMLTCRVDWLALALSFGGLAACVFLEKRWYVAAALFSAALFVKYSFLAAPLACAWWLVTRRDWKALTRLAFGSAAICVAAFCLAQRWSGGNFAFYQFGTHPDPYSFSQCLKFLSDRIAAIPLFFGIAVVAAAGDAAKKKLALPAIYFFSSTLGALTLGKAGSNTNHLIEWTAAICWCAGYGWRFVEDWLRGKNLVVASRLAITAVFITTFLTFVTYRPPMEERTLCGATYTYLKSHGDSVLTDSVGALLLTGKPVLVSNPFVHTQLVSHGKLDRDQIEERVLQKKFDVILLRDPIGAYPADVRFTRGTLQAIRQNYHEGAAFECFDSNFAYVPNP
jgi:hypothetical protein